MVKVELNQPKMKAKTLFYFKTRGGGGGGHSGQKLWQEAEHLKIKFLTFFITALLG
jgi:hypothetical protein